MMIPLSARADSATRVMLSVGGVAGDRHYAGDRGTTVGIDGDAEVRVGMFSIGGSIGYDDFAAGGGVPVHANTYAGHVGVAMPLTTHDRRVHAIAFDAIGAVDGGVHRFSLDNDHEDFLFGGTTSYRGDHASIGFVGARLGAEMTLQRAHWNTGMVFRLELIGRRDVRQQELAWNRTSCGGLFSSPNDCSMTSGTTIVGGTEVGVASSIGVVF